MSAPFKVGDVVIGQHFVRDTEYNGREAVVISPTEFGEFDTPDGVVDCFACEVLWADGLREWQKLYRLRLRKPPAADSNERMYMQKWRDMDKAPQRVGEPA